MRPVFLHPTSFQLFLLTAWGIPVRFLVNRPRANRHPEKDLKLCLDAHQARRQAAGELLEQIVAKLEILLRQN